MALVDIDEIKRGAEEIRETALLSAALAGIHLAISSTLEIDEILNRAVVESAEALQAETASIAVREDDAWVTRYAHGYDTDVLGTQVLRRGAASRCPGGRHQGSGGDQPRR